MADNGVCPPMGHMPLSAAGSCRRNISPFSLPLLEARWEEQQREEAKRGDSCGRVQSIEVDRRGQTVSTSPSSPLRLPEGGASNAITLAMSQNRLSLAEVGRSSARPCQRQYGA